MAHSLRVVEDSTPLRSGCWCRTITGNRDREFDPRVTRVVVDDLQLSLRCRIVEAAFQSVEEILVEKFELYRQNYPVAHSKCQSLRSRIYRL